jgi:ParB family chromosome partitioning protein
MPWGATNGLRELEGVETPMSPDEEKKLAALQDEADALEAEWADAPEIPDEVNARLVTLDEKIGALVDRPMTFAPEDMARAGVFVSIDSDGSLCIDRGYVRPEDEPVAQADEEQDVDAAPDQRAKPNDLEAGAGATVVGIGKPSDEEDDADEEVVKPLNDRLVAELTAWRTLALQNAFAQSPTTAFAAVLHAFVLASFYYTSSESCLQISLNKPSFGFSPTGLRDSAPAKTIAERHKRWADRLPDSEKELWDALLQLDAAEQAALFALGVLLLGTLSLPRSASPWLRNGGRDARFLVETRPTPDPAIDAAIIERPDAQRDN